LGEQWTAAQLPDLGGTAALVTGANSGLGYETALALAGAGARVVLACRSREKAEAAMAQIRAAHPAAALEFQPLDLASLESVRAAAAAVSARHPRLDRLVNNAGLMALPERRTAEGLEMQLGVNHFGHFALTGLLLPALLAAPAPRVVSVSSLAHRMGRMDFEDLQWRRRYSRWGAYGRSKLANLLFAFELDRRARAAGSPLVSAAAHPGYSATNLQTASARQEGAALTEGVMNLGNGLLAQSAAMGALPSLYAAAAPGGRGGAFYGPGGVGELRGFPREVGASRRARDPQAAARLWEVSEAQTGVTFSWS
jgi:NAD(P)-dependent dehydrogenase (short-subunit alcohol dehydrogenase family)